METILTVLHVFVGLVLILVVLLQTGKGNAMGGSAFGGSSQTVFGSSGAGNFLTKFTTASAIIFMLTSLTLSAMTSKKEKVSLLTTTDTSRPVETPAAPLPTLPEETQGQGNTATETAKSAEVDVPPSSIPAQTGGTVPASPEVPAGKKTN